MRRSPWSFRLLNGITLFVLLLNLVQMQPASALAQETHTREIRTRDPRAASSDAMGPPSPSLASTIPDGWAAAHSPPGEAEAADHPPALDIPFTASENGAQDGNSRVPVEQTTRASPSVAQVETTLGSSLMFIENVGQFAEDARFQVRGGGRTMWLAEDGLWVTVMKPMSPTLALSPRLSDRERERENKPSCGVHLKLSFPGANSHPRLEPFNRLDTRLSYFTGDDPAQWRTDVPVWGGVRYVDLYPGVDLEVAGEKDRWTWRLVSRRFPFAVRHSDIRLRVDGADTLALDDAGRLRLTTAVGDFTLPLLQTVAANRTTTRPATTQPEINGLEIMSPFATDALHLALQEEQVGNGGLSSQSNSSNLLYSTFLGGDDDDYGYGIAVDEADNAYVTGYTWSSDFPTTPGAFDPLHNGDGDAFVVKLNADGTELIYATFLGGEDDDSGCGITVDEAGSAYVTGGTESDNFPTTQGAFDQVHGPQYCSGNGHPILCFDAFVVKVNADGTDLEYATFLGGNDDDGNDVGQAIAVDEAGKIHVTGETESDDFPTKEAYDATYNNWSDAFMVKLDPTGNGQADLLYATFIGGNDDDYGHSIAVDEAGNAYVAGETWSSDFPTKDAYDTDCGGCHDAFVVKLDPSSSGEDSLLSATFLGGGDDDCGYGIAVDKAGNTYVTGGTWSSDFPTKDAYDADCGDGDDCHDAFVVKLDPSSSGEDSLLSATFLGGDDDDCGYGIAVDKAGNTYVTGETWSSDFPTTTHAFSTTRSGGADAFVVKLNPVDNGGNDLRYATFLGGDGDDYGYAIAVDNAGNAYVTGQTESSDFPTTTHAFDPSYNGGYWDAFVAAVRITPLIDVQVSTSTLTLNEEGWPMPNPLVVTVTVNNVTTSTIANTTAIFTATSPGGAARFLALTDEEKARADREKVFSSPSEWVQVLEFGTLSPTESVSVTFPIWIQPSETTVLTLAASLIVSPSIGQPASDREVVSIPTAEIRPVVFLHGILGSMPPENHIVDEWPQRWEPAQLDPWLDSYNPLIENLMKMGYELDRTLFPVLYDWRQSNRVSGAWLGEALAETVIPKSQDVPYVISNTNKADVVVHSMGGLVIRAYVQGKARDLAGQDRPYQGDVNKVVFIATPHRGFPVTYRTWEGLTWEEYLGRDVSGQADLVLPFQIFRYHSLLELMDDLLWPYFILKQYQPDPGQACWTQTIPIVGMVGALEEHLLYDAYPCPQRTLQKYSHSTDPEHLGIGSLPEMLPPVSDALYPEAASRSIPPYLYNDEENYPHGYQVNPLLEEGGLNAPGVQTTLDGAIGLDNIYVIYGAGVDTALRYWVRPPYDSPLPWLLGWPPWPNGAVPSANWETEYTTAGDDLIPTYSTRLRDSDQPGQPGQGLLPDLPEENEIGIAEAEHKGIVYHAEAQRVVGSILTGIGDRVSFPLDTLYNPANFFFNNADVIAVIIFWSPVDGMVTNPSGQRVGYDPDADQIVNEIPGAYYSGNAGELEFFLLPGGLEGDYTVIASGTSSGDYLVTMYRADTSGARLTSAITGTASVGEVLTGTVAYTVPAASLFFDDLESGGGNWVAEGGWSLVTDTARSPVVWGGETITPGVPLTLTLQPSLDLSTTRMARLTFWHSYTLSSEAQARVELSTDGGATWGTLSARHDANGWMPVEIDLTPFTGPDYAPLRLRFRLLPARAGDRWQIDDVSVEDLEIPWLFALPFEDDVEGWRRWDGTGDWAVVTGTVHGGQRSLAAAQEGSTLTLVGPLDLRETISPTLTFWYTMTTNGTGLVEVSTDGAAWQPATTVTETTDWTQAEVDLSAWAGLTPTLRLRHAGQAGSLWAVDDLLVRNVVPPVVHTLPFSDDMETPGNWQPFGGWETITETAHSNTTAWRGDVSDSALVLVDRLDLTDTASPMLTFWQQFALPEESMGHVKVTTDDGLTWQSVLTITDPFSDWAQVQVNLSDYAGQEIGLKFYLDEVVTGSMASSVRPIANSRQEVYHPTSHQGEGEQTDTPGVVILLPFALTVLCCGTVLTIEKRGRRRVLVLLAILGMSSAMLACGRMSDERRYARINKLTDVLGEVELVVGAEHRPSSARLSPGGRWMAVKLGPSYLEWLLVDLTTGEMHKLEQPIGDIQWISDEYCAASYSTKSYLIHLPDLAVTRLVTTDTVEAIKGAEDVYVLWRFGVRNENAVSTTDPEFPYIVLDYFSPEEIEQQMGDTPYEIVSWETYVDSSERAYSPDGRYYLYTIIGDRTAIYDAQTDEPVAYGYKRLWHNQELGWAYDSSGVYVIYFGATVDEGAANPYHPIYKWLVPGAAPRGTPAPSTGSGQAPAGESRVPGDGQLLPVSHFLAPVAEEVTAGWYVDDVAVRDAKPYRIARATIATSGGVISSTSFIIKGTVGQIDTFLRSSESYRIRGGIWNGEGE